MSGGAIPSAPEPEKRAGEPVEEYLRRLLAWIENGIREEDKTIAEHQEILKHLAAEDERDRITQEQNRRQQEEDRQTRQAVREAILGEAEAIKAQVLKLRAKPPDHGSHGGGRRAP